MNTVALVFVCIAAIIGLNCILGLLWQVCGVMMVNCIIGRIERNGGGGGANVTFGLDSADGRV